MNTITVDLCLGTELVGQVGHGRFNEPLNDSSPVSWESLGCYRIYGPRKYPLYKSRISVIFRQINFKPRQK